MDEALRVREFWFGKTLTGPFQGAESRSRADALNRRMQLWFETDPQVLGQWDERVRTEFQPWVERAARGELSGWADSPRRRLSLIILLDQFPRQIYRGTAKAFAYDHEALVLALSGIESAADGALNVVERLFFYMPLQHAEATEVQDESVAAFTRLLSESPPEMKPVFRESLDYALEHRELIRKFGRFPHRNVALGRASTPEELAYLKQSPESFGQS